VDLQRLHEAIAKRSEEAQERMDPGLAAPRDLARDFGALARAGVFRRWEAGGLGPMGIALSPKADRLYVANFFSDTVTALDARTGQLVGTIRIGPEKPMSTVRRGHFLFHDARRSCFQGWLSCSSCHPDVGADGLNWDLLNDGIGNRKNTKMLIGSHETPPSMSAGVRADMTVAVAKGFQFIQFRHHTPEEQHAVVEFLKWIRHRPSPFHRLADGSPDPIAQAGKKLFEDPRVGCSTCHPPPLFTTKKLYDVGTRGPEDRRDAFDTPSLRELYRTAPYLHDGRAATLRGVLTTFNRKDRHGHTAHLSADEIADLAAYLRSL
jgi:cytochrome c peroxidase